MDELENCPKEELVNFIHYYSSNGLMNEEDKIPLFERFVDRYFEQKEELKKKKV